MKSLTALLVGLLLSASLALGQTQTPFSTVSVTATATGLSGSGASTAATLIMGSVPVSSKVSLGTLVLLDSSSNVQGYFGQADYNLPLPKSVDAQKFQFYVAGAFGIDSVTPANAPTQQHLAGGGFVGMNYDPTGAGHFGVGPMVGYLRLQGAPNPNVAVVAMGASISFGK